MKTNKGFERYKVSNLLRENIHYEGDFAVLDLKDSIHTKDINDMNIEGNFLKISLNESGTSKIKKLTSNENLGRRIALIHNGKLIQMAEIKEELGSEINLSFFAYRDELEQMATKCNPKYNLPCPTKYLEERSFLLIEPD